MRGVAQKLTGVLQAGNQVGEAFWKMLLAEHGLSKSGVGDSHICDASEN